MGKTFKRNSQYKPKKQGREFVKTKDKRRYRDMPMIKDYNIELEDDRPTS